ncbi:MAG: RlmE family RNA methyltransferase [Deltaproteobacteria bacterium]|nr:RlmE family RNA methyltransferase [Deltaproteobacteria bacterium]
MARGYKGRDTYSQQAHDDGYAARSVYKLSAIDKRVRIFRQGQRVVDLGCFPGSWSRYALEHIGPSGTLVGLDLEVPRLSGGIFFARSVYEVQASELIALLGGPADVLLSDMAQKTMGDRHVDHYAQIALARTALGLAAQVLRPGGSFVCKVFEGEESSDFQKEAQEIFKKVRRMRPDAVRKQSREWFLVAEDRREVEALADGEGP